MTATQLLVLETGDPIEHRGRTYSYYGPEGWTWGARNGREYADVPVFKTGGGKSFIRIYVSGE